MSQDSTKPGYSLADDKFAAVKEDDVRDDNPRVLARRIDTLTGEVRDGFAGINQQLLPAINRINDALADIAVRLNRLEKNQVSHADRLTALEQHAKRRMKAARK